MFNPSEKTLALFSLTACGGCLEMLKNMPLSLHTFYEINDEKYDIAIIEGHPLTDKQIELVKTIRSHAETVIAIGACAHIGGVYLNKEKTLSKIIRVDHIIPGCPPSQKEIEQCMMDLYWGKIFHLPDLAVCFECRQNENECLIKKKKLCLGPITRGGCNSICVNHGEACLGCRGLKPAANLEKMTEILKPIVPEKEIGNIFSIFGDLNEKH